MTTMQPSTETSRTQTAKPSMHEHLLGLLSGPLAAAHYELVDVVTTGLGTAAATVEVFVDNSVDHPLGGRIDLDGVSAATRLIDGVLEAADPIDGAFTLEVSSPGLERALRTPAHFGRFVGTTVSVKTLPGTSSERRVEGRLDAADSDPSGAVTVGGVAIPYASIERARTVFVWGPQAKPGSGPSKSAAKRAAKAAGSQNVPRGSASESSGPEAAPDKQTPVSSGVDHDEE
jgi:ribosome maturation factor RimP